MISGAQFKELTKNDENSSYLQDYKTILPKLICNDPTSLCYSFDCKKCPGVEDLKTTLKNLFEENFIETITYKKWTSTDRSDLETLIDTVDEFVDKFTVGISKLVTYDYIAKSQSKFLEESKQTLGPGEFVVLADFAENFSCLIQDAIQSYHWNNTQVTIHPFVVY